MQLSPSHFQLGSAVLAGAGASDRPAERLRHRLKAVTDSEHRHAQVEDLGVQLRRALFVDTGRAPGQHDGLRVARLDLLDGGGMRNDLRKHPRFADPSRDQLRILRSEVDHQHGTGRTCCHPDSLVSGATAPARRRRW
jgi:hypothetical protein